MPTKKKIAKEPETAKWAPPRMAQSELRQFVLDYCDDKIFTDKHVHNIDMLHLVFMILVFADTKDWDLKQIGFMYEYMDQAGPRSINGMPVFFSARFMHIEDAKIVGPAIDREMLRRKELPILIPEAPEPQQSEQPELFNNQGNTNANPSQTK